VAKSLIIVSGENEKVYAELLLSLVTLIDDDKENGKVVGIKDGSVNATIWSEKIYEDNNPQMTSSSKIVFLGKSKSTEFILPNIKFNEELKKYGIFMGCTGNKYVIYTDANILINNKTLYDEFFDLYKNLVDKFDDTVADSSVVKKARHTDDLGTAIGKGVENVVGLVGNLFNIFSGEHKEIELKGTDAFDIGAKIEAGKAIPDQMFRFIILSLYLNDLYKFMEN